MHFPIYEKTTITRDDLVAEYERLTALAIGSSGAGRTMTLGWDLEYTSPDALLAFIDQILYRRMNDFVPDGDRPVILDCGANIGYTSLHYKRQYPGADITAFEPDPEFVPILRRNLARNDASDVTLVEAAVWTGDGRAPWVMEGKDGSRLVTDGSIDVATVDLTPYLDRDIDLLKLDIEGAEFAVVQHLARSLGRVKNILVECHLAGQESYEHFAGLLTMLRAAGFSISLNSYGPWRDLTRRHVAAPLHAEQYVLVTGWRTESVSVSRDPVYGPYVGLPLEIETRRRLQVVKTEKDLVARVLAGLVTNSGRWAIHQMRPPFERESGRCWTWRCPKGLPGGDAPESSDSSTLVLEGDGLLGPGHSLHDDIRLKGGGRFSHWRTEIYFSSSDDTDPNTNRRRYTAILQR